MQNNPHTLSFLMAVARLTDMVELLDEMHTTASEGCLDVVNASGKAELIGWLKEIAFIASETAAELEQTPVAQERRKDKDSPEPSAEAGTPVFQTRVAAEHLTPTFYVMKRAGG
ncbi:MAG: hypothetical protein ACOYL5_08650 [Phototrophicaceae bacterium]|jgi:hypothetical protein